MSNSFLLKLGRELLTLCIPVMLISLLAIGCSGESEKSTKTQKEVAQTETQIHSTQEAISHPDKPECTTYDIELEQGKLCGLKITNSDGTLSDAYLGIPFAETTAGENRWRAPVPNQGWQGTLKATANGPACPQTNRLKPGLPYSEDCLSVNVWTPADSSQEPRSVLVFLYGGGFNYGHNGNPVYDGAYKAAKGDVIVVAINYRVASLGFLAGIKDKNTGEELNGNYGFLDQILALKWVRENIRNFGGDPEKITLYGESAGALSVAIHLTASPKSRDMFRSAIIQSNPLGLPLKNPKQAGDVAKMFVNNLSCSHEDIACMRSIPVEKIVEAQKMSNMKIEALTHSFRDFLLWGPVIDGEIVTGHPLNEISKKPIQKPLITGINKNEGLIFISLPMLELGLKDVDNIEYSLALDVIFQDKEVKDQIMKRYPEDGRNNKEQLSEILTDYLFICPTLDFSDNSSLKTWVYQFDHIPSFNVFDVIDVVSCQDAVCHGAELAFVFHTAENIGFEFTQQERLLSRLMVNYWTNFAKNQDPNGNAPDWPGYKSRESNVILITPIDEIETKDDIRAKCSLWDKIGYDYDANFWNIF